VIVDVMATGKIFEPERLNLWHVEKHEVEAVV
jgi:hypothetical protein